MLLKRTNSGVNNGSNQFGGSKTDTIVKLILVFFISLLSFSVGTFVGKQFSDSEHRLASLETEYNKGAKDERETASVPEDTLEMEPSEILSKDDVAKLAEEFVAEKPEHKRDVANVEKDEHTLPTNAHAETQAEAPAEKHGEKHGETHAETPAKADPMDVALRPAEKIAKGEAPVKPMKPEVKKVMPTLPSVVTADARGKYTIQVSSHQTENEAKVRADELSNKGFVASYIPAVVDGKTWYRVGVGAFSTVDTAKEYLTQVRKNPVFKGAIIRKMADERTPSNY